MKLGSRLWRPHLTLVFPTQLKNAFEGHILVLNTNKHWNQSVHLYLRFDLYFCVESRSDNVKLICSALAFLWEFEQFWHFVWQDNQYAAHILSCCPYLESGHVRKCPVIINNSVQLWGQALAAKTSNIFDLGGKSEQSNSAHWRKFRLKPKLVDFGSTQNF